MRSPMRSQTDAAGVRARAPPAARLLSLGGRTALAAGREAPLEPLELIFPSLVVTTTMPPA
jgi:hypothetical protein